VACAHSASQRLALRAASDLGHTIEAEATIDSSRRAPLCELAGHEAKPVQNSSIVELINLGVY